VLEVGANEQRLLAAFLPEVKFVFSDLFMPSNADESFVQADATALPFIDNHFEAVICLDVLEHMPPSKRAAAVTEMARVSRRLVVIACPPNDVRVKEAEDAANGIWQAYYGQSYRWLDEHKEFGLVIPEEVEKALRSAGMHAARFSQGDPTLWTTLMGAHFVKEVVSELSPLVSAIHSLYNRVLFPVDRGDTGYRDFFVAAASEQDLHMLMHLSPPATDTRAAVKDFLSGITGALRPVIDRVRVAESQWAETARLVGEIERGQSVATTGWKETVERFHESERLLSESRSAAAEWEHQLKLSTMRLQETQLALGAEQVKLSETQGNLNSETERAVNLEQALSVERAGHAQTLDRAQQLEERTQQLVGRTQQLEKRLRLAVLAAASLAIAVLVCILKK
jgi:hypothetical protein